jgi:lipopolysaccharide transport protein LptA
MKSLIAMAALAAVIAAQPAAAQAPAAAPAAKSNSKAPVDVSADQAEFHSNDCTYVYTGSAEALQDTSRLRSDIMIGRQEVAKGKPKAATATTGAAANSNNCGATLSIEAKGHVYYVAADGRRVHGDNAFYDFSNSTVTITGDVTAVDASNNVMRGTKMIYNTDTGEGHVEGGGKGPNGKNRPRGVFYPKNSDQTDGTAADGKAPDQGKTKKAAK